MPVLRLLIATLLMGSLPAALAPDAAEAQLSDALSQDLRSPLPRDLALEALDALPPARQANAYEAIGTRRELAAKPLLLHALASADEHVLEAGLRGLSQLVPTSTEDHAIVASCLEGPSSNVAISAIQCLGAWADLRDGKALVACLGSGDPQRVQAAAHALEDMTQQHLATDAAAWSDWFAHWHETNDPQLEAVRDHLRSPQVSVVLDAMRTAASVPGWHDAAIEILLPLTDDDDATVRATATALLHRLEPSVFAAPAMSAAAAPAGITTSTSSAPQERSHGVLAFLVPLAATLLVAGGTLGYLARQMKPIPRRVPAPAPTATRMVPAGMRPARPRTGTAPAGPAAPPRPAAAPPRPSAASPARASSSKDAQKFWSLD